MTSRTNTTSNSRTVRHSSKNGTPFSSSPLFDGESLLAIDPGFNRIGLAAFEGKDLVDYAVRITPKKPSIRERLLYLDKTITRYVNEKKPVLIALEKSNFCSSTQNGLLILAYYKILAVAKRHNIPVYLYSPITIRKTVCGDGHATKQDVMKILISCYPELRVFTGTDRRWKQNHYYNLFDAVAVGITHMNKHQTGVGKSQ